MITPLKTALLLSYICIASISAAIITPALHNIQTFFDLGKGSVQWVVSIFLLGYVVGQLIYAPLANRYGRLNALRCGLAVNIIGILVCLLSVDLSNFSLLLFGRLITALGAASGLSCTFILINELLTPAKAKHAMSLSIISFTIGIGLAVFLGSQITDYFHWQDCFILLLIHGAVMFILTWQFPETLKTPRAIHPIAIIEQYLAAFRHKTLLIFSLVAGFVSVFSYGYAVTAPLYTQLTLKLSIGDYGLWNFLNMVGMLGSGFLCAYLIKKIGEKRTLQMGLLVIIPALIGLCVLSLLHIHNVLYFFLLSAYLYLVTGLLFPTASYFASNAISDRASASSVMSFINMGCAMVGVIIMGYLPFHALNAYLVVMGGFFVVIGVLVVVAG